MVLYELRRYVLVMLILITRSERVMPNACCPDVWVAYKGSCYLFGKDTSISFYEAEHFCRQHGGHLVHVDSVVENAFLKSYLGGLKPADYWIGLTDELVEGVFEWYDTHTAPTFTDWGKGYPDNSRGAEDCAHFYKDIGFFWNDAPCSNMYKPLCEMRSAELAVIG